MKPFIYSVITIITALLLLFAITLLLDWHFIQAQFVRQVLIYLLMLILVFVGIRIVVLINK